MRCLNSTYFSHRMLAFHMDILYIIFSMLIVFFLLPERETMLCICLLLSFTCAHKPAKGTPGGVEYWVSLGGGLNYTNGPLDSHQLQHICISPHPTAQRIHLAYGFLI